MFNPAITPYVSVELRDCVVCGSLDGPRVFDFDADVCGLGRVTFGIRCCVSCGMVQQDPVVAPTLIERQYAAFSNYTRFSAGEPPLSPSMARLLALAERWRPARGRVYDIGAATGDGLFHFRNAGWSVGGCEPSPAALRQASVFNGVALDLGSEETALPARSDLDVVTLSHVLEHVYDPAATLRRIAGALKPDGLVALEVPCLTAPEINPPGLFMMEHLNYFDEDSIKNLLGVCGFSVLESVVSLDFRPFPAIALIARKGPANAGRHSGFTKALAFCEAYLRYEEAVWRATEDHLRRSVSPGERIIIWGAGLHTSALLSRTRLLAFADLVGVTDRDVQKHGQTLYGTQVLAPEAALALGVSVVISSYCSEPAIAAALRAQGVAARRIISLYDRSGAPDAG